MTDDEVGGDGIFFVEGTYQRLWVDRRALDFNRHTGFLPKLRPPIETLKRKRTSGHT